MIGLLSKANLSKALMEMAFDYITDEDITIRIGEKLALSFRISRDGKTEDGKEVFKINGRLIRG